jgi:phosphatidylglycerophosphate synthase
MTGKMRDRRPIPARSSRVSQQVARRLAEAGVTPNHISIFGFGAAVIAGLCLAATPLAGVGGGRALFLAAALLIVVRGLSNMFDGMVAVEHGKGTAVGVLYNEVPDRFSDVAIFVGGGYAVGGIPDLGFAAAAVAVLIAFVRLAARMAGAPSDFAGIMAKQQRMFLLAAVAAWLAVTPLSWQPAFGPDDAFGLMSLVSLVIVIGGVATIAGRLRRAARFLGSATVAEEPAP